MSAEAARLWVATANPDGPGLLERGREFEPSLREAYNPLVLEAVLRLARLAVSAAETVRDSPDARLRRSGAVLAARAHPLLVAFDGV